MSQMESMSDLSVSATWIAESPVRMVGIMLGKFSALDQL